MDLITKAANVIKNSKRVCAFTGAGISVESGIPPFRGANGLWAKYDPSFIDISFFEEHYERSWEKIKEVFYDFFGKAQPNHAHLGIAELEKMGYIKTVVTQNIDNLHQLAGSKNVIEYHGTASTLLCLSCGSKFKAEEFSFKNMPPKCPHCKNKSIKPDFVFYGEGIPEPANSLAFKEAELSDVFIVVGTTGEVMPACYIPMMAKQRGATIIEINPSSSAFTNSITDIYIKLPAGEAFDALMKEFKN